MSSLARWGSRKVRTSRHFRWLSSDHGIDQTPKVYKTRRKNFWEPFYDPAAKNFVVCSFNPALSAGPKNSVVLQSSFGGHDVIEKASFIRCDFRDQFEDLRFTFKSCSFEDCDFGQSTWKNAKFNSCRFQQCSFSQSDWTNCQFINCSWTAIYFSDLNLFDTIIDNPEVFVDAASTNLDPQVLIANGVKKSLQIFRLEGTKSTIARSLVANLSSRGDENPITTRLNHTIARYIGSELLIRGICLEQGLYCSAFGHLYRFSRQNLSEPLSGQLERSIIGVKASSSRFIWAYLFGFSFQYFIDITGYVIHGVTLFCLAPI